MNLPQVSPTERLGPWFSSSPVGDLWRDAEMHQVLVYLRGNKSLRLPEYLRPLFPVEQ